MRAKGWDYSSTGAYHVTICAKDHARIFGMIENGDTRLSSFGNACACAIELTVQNYPCASIPKFVIMPNHVHLIVEINQSQENGTSLPSVVRYLKSQATRFARAITPGVVIWQRGYYDHIIRDEEDYRNVWAYIDGNPAKWEDDEYY